MNINGILKDVLNEPQLTETGCFDTDVFFYLSGRHPELTIREAVEVVKLAREEWRFSRGRRMSEIDDMVCKLAEAEVTSELEYMLWEIYKECDSEDELEEKYDEIRSLSACCLERRAEEIGLNPDTVSY